MTKAEKSAETIGVVIGVVFMTATRLLVIAACSKYLLN